MIYVSGDIFMRKCKQSKNVIKKKMVFLLVLFVITSLVSTFQYKKLISPNIDAIGEIKAKGMVTEIINNTISHGFSNNEYYEDKNLFYVKTGKDGEINMVQSNTQLINKMVSQFAETLQENYSKVEEQKIKVSYGAILGSKILSQVDLNVNLRVLPLSVSNFDFITEFETQGINQTKYKVYVIIDSNVRVLAPFIASDFHIKNKILIAETVIVGDVPNSYVVVPEKNILDVTDE